MGFENKKKSSDVDHSDDGERGEGLQSFATPRLLSVRGGHDRGKDKVDQVNEASLMSHDLNSLVSIGTYANRPPQAESGGRPGREDRKRDRKHI